MMHKPRLTEPVMRGLTLLEDGGYQEAMKSEGIPYGELDSDTLKACTAACRAANHPFKRSEHVDVAHATEWLRDMRAWRRWNASRKEADRGA